MAAYKTIATAVLNGATEAEAVREYIREKGTMKATQTDNRAATPATWPSDYYELLDDVRDYYEGDRPEGTEIRVSVPMALYIDVDSVSNICDKLLELCGSPDAEIGYDLSRIIGGHARLYIGYGDAKADTGI
jgi:hypothetical protein